MRRIKSAISVARSVMEHTTHTLLIGEEGISVMIKIIVMLINLLTTSFVYLTQACLVHIFLRINLEILWDFFIDPLKGMTAVSGKMIAECRLNFTCICQ